MLFYYGFKFEIQIFDVTLVMVFGPIVKVMAGLIQFCSEFKSLQYNDILIWCFNEV